jgi:hypothetical protein
VTPYTVSGSREERRQHEEAVARERAEEESRRREAEARRKAEEAEEREAEAQRLAEKSRQQAEKEQQRAQEEERRKRQEVETRQRAEAQRVVREAQAQKRAEQERAFAAAKEADSVNAVDEFLGTYPDSHVGADAKALRASMVEREDAYAATIQSNDAAALKGFLRRYPRGKAADEVRSRLRTLEPWQTQQASRRAVVIGGIGTASALAVASADYLSRKGQESVEIEPPGVPPPKISAGRLLHVLSGHTAPLDWATFSTDGSAFLPSQTTLQSMEGRSTVRPSSGTLPLEL